MRAWEWSGAPEVVLVERPEAPTPDGHALLEPLANGFCATDLELVTGRLPDSVPPLVPGHEIVARVVEAPDGSLPAGARVVVDTMIGCGRCDACRAGRTQICPGVTELGLTRDGGWRDRLTAPVANCHVLPDAVPTALAALVEPLSCQLGLVRAAELGPGDHVLIVGSGVAALLYTQLCVVHGAGAVAVAVDDEARGEVARALGADHVILAPDRPSAEAGYTKAIDAVGTEASLASCVESVAPGGHVSLYGLGAARPAFPLHIAIFKNLTLSGHTSAPWLWEDAIALVAEGRVALEPLVTDRVAFGDVGEFLSEALQGALAGPRIKAVIDHAEPPKTSADAPAPGFRSTP